MGVQQMHSLAQSVMTAKLSAFSLWLSVKNMHVYIRSTVTALTPDEAYYNYNEPIAPWLHYLFLANKLTTPPFNRMPSPSSSGAEGELMGLVLVVIEQDGSALWVFAPKSSLCLNPPVQAHPFLNHLN